MDQTDNRTDQTAAEELRLESNTHPNAGHSGANSGADVEPLTKKLEALGYLDCGLDI